MKTDPFPKVDLSEIDWIEIGRQVENDPTRDGFRRQGRPLLNAEMEAARMYRRQQTDKILEEL